MEKTLSLGAFEELSENEIKETEGGVWWILPVVLGALGAVGVGAVAVSVGNHNNLVQAQNKANETGTPQVAKQYFKDDITVQPQPSLLDQIGY